MENKYTQQESLLKIFEDTIKNLEKTGGCQVKTPTRKSRKSHYAWIECKSCLINAINVKFLWSQACVYNIHTFLPAEGQCNASKK